MSFIDELLKTKSSFTEVVKKLKKKLSEERLAKIALQNALIKF